MVDPSRLPQNRPGSRTLRAQVPPMSGIDVLALQEALVSGGASLATDGIYGPGTVTDVKEWQTGAKLVADGVVGPASWSALGVTASYTPAGATSAGRPEVSGTAAANDRWAYEVAKRAAPTMPEAQRQYVLAVARGEGNYGLGWKEGRGKGSNNWGAVQGTGPAGSFQTTDSGWKKDPVTGQQVWQQYTGTFKRYNTPEEGFLDMARIILNGGPIRKAAGAAAIQAAIARGNLKDAVNEQHANRYFELSPAKYFIAMQNNFEALSESTGWKRKLSAVGDFVVAHVEGMQKGIAIAAGTIITGLISWFLLKRKRT